MISEFLYDGTTHVLASKRNLPLALQGLVSARFIVTNTYVDAVVQAASSPGVDTDGETPLRSLLEQDFDLNWPDPMNFVPPTSNEPVPREASFLAPDTERTALFEDSTFVFCTAEQQASLEPAISLGGGKCPLFLVDVGVTPASSLTDYVRSLAGKGSLGGLNSDSPKGVVVVRIQRKEETRESADWINRFFQDVDRNLDQRSIYQNEFLDAILTKNIATLKKALEYEDEEASPTSASRVSDTAGQTDARPLDPTPEQRSNSQSTSQQQLEQPDPDTQPSQGLTSRFRNRRTVTKSRFKGFDDFDDDDIIAQPPDSAPSEAQDAMEVEPTPPSNQRAVQPPETQESQGLFVHDSQAAEAPPSRKRPAQPESNDEPIDTNEAMDNLFPGSRAMKKRRLEQGATTTTIVTKAPAARQSVPPSRSPSVAPAKSKSKPKPKIKNETDILARAKEHATEIDKRKEEPSNSDNDAESISQLKDLALIEEMDVPRLSHRRRHNAPTTAHDDHPEWAGRRNFKKFRRKGADGSSGHYNRGTRVIVPLEASAERDYGIGDRYWLSLPSSHSSKRSKNRSQADSAPDDGDDGAKDSDVEADEAEMARLSEVLPEELAGPQRDGWVTHKLQESKGAAGGKRAAEESASPPRRKRQQMVGTSSRGRARGRGKIDLGLVMEEDGADEESDEDELKFRLRR